MPYFGCRQPGMGGVGGCGRLSKGRCPTPDNQGARAFIDRRRGLHAETIQSALTVILKLVIGGLTSLILLVLGTVNLQFQVRFVSISLRPFLAIVAAYVVATVWSSCSSLIPPGGSFSIYKTAHRTWLRILSTALEAAQKVLDYMTKRLFGLL